MLSRLPRPVVPSFALLLASIVSVAVATSQGETAGPVVDAGRYFPFAEGALWTYAVDESLGILGGQHYERTVRITDREPAGDGESATFAHEASDDMESSYNQILAKNGAGISTFGNDDASDPYTALFAPYWEVRFDLPVGKSFVQFERAGITLGEDYDADGRNDVGDVRSEVELIGVEPVAVAAGNFAEALVVRRNTRLKIHFSSGGEDTLTEVDRRWFAKDVGLVKATWELRSESDGELQNRGGEELAGYSVAGRSAGRLAAENLDDDLRIPSAKPFATDSAANTHGSVVVYCDAAESSATSGIFAVYVSPLGDATPPQRLTHQSCFGIPPRVATDGAGYLVAFTRDHPVFSGVSEVAALRLSRSGQILDATPFSVSASGVDGSAAPAIVFDGQDYVVLYRSGVTSALAEAWLEASRVSPAGVVSAPTTLELAPGTRVPHSLDLEFDGDGFLAIGVIEPHGNGIGARDVYGLRFDKSLAVRGGLLPISTAPGDQSDPAIAFDGDDYLVVWVDGRDRSLPATSPRWTVYGTRISPAGLLLDGDASTGTPVDVPSFAAEGLDLAFDGSRFALIGAASGRTSLLRFAAAEWPLEAGNHTVRSVADAADASMLGASAAGTAGRALIAWADVPAFSAAGDLYAVTVF